MSVWLERCSDVVFGQGKGRGKEKEERKKNEIKRTLTFLFKCQLSLFIVVFVLPSTPVFTSLLIPPRKKHICPYVSFFVRFIMPIVHIIRQELCLCRRGACVRMCVCVVDVSKLTFPLFLGIATSYSNRTLVAVV